MFLKEEKKSKNFDEILYDLEVSLSRASFFMFRVALEDTPAVQIGNPKKDTDSVVMAEARDHWNDVVTNARNAIKASKLENSARIEEGRRNLQTQVGKSRIFLQNNGDNITILDKEYESGGKVKNFHPYIFQIKDGGNLGSVSFSVINNYFMPKKDLIERGDLKKDILSNYKQAFSKFAAENGEIDKEKIIEEYEPNKKDWDFSRKFYGKDIDQTAKKAAEPYETFVGRMHSSIEKNLGQLTSSVVKAFSSGADEKDKTDLAQNGTIIKNSLSLLSEAGSAIDDIFGITEDIYSFSSGVIESAVSGYAEKKKIKETEDEKSRDLVNKQKEVSNF
jgi:hypothetical protein